jgi:hypothetical protein
MHTCPTDTYVSGQELKQVELGAKSVKFCWQVKQAFAEEQVRQLLTQELQKGPFT